MCIVGIVAVDIVAEETAAASVTAVVTVVMVVMMGAAEASIKRWV